LGKKNLSELRLNYLIDRKREGVFK
jgi:hypothetical protein